mmetsp:Transcript_52/g.141  ORF Transcript_52/g.141 Transcript_52/m.141 type:complete len:124 (+) Transcript_52:3698-4069(+)
MFAHSSVGCSGARFHLSIRTDLLTWTAPCVVLDHEGGLTHFCFTSSVSVDLAALSAFLLSVVLVVVECSHGETAQTTAAAELARLASVCSNTRKGVVFKGLSSLCRCSEDNLNSISPCAGAAG